MSVVAAIRGALNLLDPGDRRKLGLSAAIQMVTSILDTIGVLLIGLVGALAVTTVQSQPPPAPVQTLVNFFGLDGLTDQQLVLLLALAAAFVLLAKSGISAFLTRRVLIFLANRQALVSARLTRELLSQPLVFVERRTSQATAYALISGCGAATSQILGQLIIVVTEGALLVAVAVALIVASPWIALGSIAFFAGIGFLLQRLMGNWATRVGSLSAEADVASLNAVQEAIATYREISVTERRQTYVDRIATLRLEASGVAADAQIIGMVPKYLFEIALVVGGFLLAIALFATESSVSAVGTLALFLAASTRVMPSLLRLQGAALGLRGAAGAAGPTFALADELNSRGSRCSASTAVTAEEATGSVQLTPSIVVEGVTFCYPKADRPALNDVSLVVEPGMSLALVGPSGAGKSTLADVLLGVLDPQAGTVLVGGFPPASSRRKWPGSIGYVPQNVTLVAGDIRSNVTLGLRSDDVDDALVWSALEQAHLAEHLRAHRDGLDTRIGERGLKLSGGQRQRLGIARALYSQPRLLVLDEATSALDAETERAVSQTLQDLEGNVTTVVIAHRLSTVRHVDRVLYLEHGEVKGAGTFDEVTRTVPAFARQAALMGL